MVFCLSYLTIVLRCIRSAVPTLDSPRMKQDCLSLMFSPHSICSMLDPYVNDWMILLVEMLLNVVYIILLICLSIALYSDLISAMLLVSDKW